MRYLGNCTFLKGSDIEEMVDTSENVSWQTIRRRVGLEIIKAVFGSPVPSLEKDIFVTFNKSTYQGQPCYFIQHSAIEYVFI